ncbi:hypothetical protein ACEWY4_017857 [Coilia grayii]|uniref:PLA2c domain-containing protein n=1 Tax=Coilia grayii TaxID=363190 RepID=A0ABD1JI04_9TELE
MDVVIRHDLCDEEKDYIHKRFQIVEGCLHSHGIDCKPNNPPRVALLGSGGGKRAQTALLGVLRQLGEDNLLDSFLYLAGVSGSTWAMASLYNDLHWSKNPADSTSGVLRSMSEGKGVTLSEGIQWLKQRDEEGDLSLADFWGVVVSYIKGVPLETRTLAEEGKGDRDGANPYPLYSAVDREMFHNKSKELWFELSHHEAGFTQPGAFVKTSLLRQDFDAGHVKQQKKRRPMDMVQLQGICGGVCGSDKAIKDYIWNCIKDWIRSFWPCVYMKGVSETEMSLFELLVCFNDMDGSPNALEKLKSHLGDDYGAFSPTLLEVDHQIWKDMTEEERNEQMLKILEELIASSEEWAQGQIKLIKTLTNVWWIFKHIWPLLKKWQFGNMGNFLYHFQDPKVPEHMCKEKIMHLIDAGLFLNSPYPPMLTDARDIDLIVSFDFSENSPFETLKVAGDYAAKIHRPFPAIDVESLDKDCPGSFYVFEERGKPTVIHIPLFNMDNCKDEPTIKKEQHEYTTFQAPYRDQKKINDLADLAAENVRMNRERILEEIRKAAERRKAKTDLCNGEKDYIQKRLQIVKGWLSSHDIDCRDNDPPRVALLGSGGGQRAQIALLGVLRQLGEDNLLDSFLYLAGVSGTTWAMASLYDDAQWSKNAPSVVSRALQSMSERSRSLFSEFGRWLRGRDAEGDLSLTDFWGVVVCAYFKGVPLETRTLAEEDQGDGANPYPLYSAVERVLLDNEKEELWFELSPHEAGFTHPGAFVKTSLLKQDFDGGHVKQQNRMPMDMVQLQGLQEIVMLSSFKLLECFNDMEGSYKVLEELKSELDGYPGLHSSTLLELDCNIWTKMTDEDKKQQIRIIFQELNESLEQQSQDMRKSKKPEHDPIWVLKKILGLAYNWDFGRTANILHNFKDPKVPEHMCKEKIMHLIDAGLFLNSPYPPMLTDTRDIDLIVSFDFSAGDPFETVKVAHGYSDTCGMPFPQINEDDMNEDRPRSFHVFEEKGKPTVIHIPLFNMDNCKDEATIKENRKKYTTFQGPYREQKKINDLADLAAENVRMNRERILEEIRKAAERRKAQC